MPMLVQLMVLLLMLFWLVLGLVSHVSALDKMLMLVLLMVQLLMLLSWVSGLVSHASKSHGGLWWCCWKTVMLVLLLLMQVLPATADCTNQKLI